MTRFVAISLTVAALLAAVLAATAGAAGTGYQAAKFLVTIKGVQKTTQQFHHKPENACDITDNSTITEKVVFQSRPAVITAFHAPGKFNPEMLAVKGSFPAKATVTRNYTPRITTPPPSPACGEADGNGEESAPKSDCGTKTTTHWGLEIGYDRKQKNGLHVFGADEYDPFNYCLAPAGALGFPFLILATTKDEPITTDIPQDELFDPGIGKIIGLAHGTEVVEEENISARVSIEWDITFKRIGKPVGS